jgi:hypothetical protein
VIQEILEDYGPIGVEVLKQAVQKVGATGKTADSIRYEVTKDRLLLIGRGYFDALETGRGPRESTQESGFTDDMLEWMKARGIGKDLTEKKRKQLARFLVLRANKEGDKLWKQGHGAKVRDVYSAVLDKFVEELTEKIAKETVKEFTQKVVNSLKNGFIGSQAA